MFAVIMAGGGGTRLWPKSREQYPKQMHALAGDKPLVQEMTERLQRIAGRDRVFIVTNSHHARLIEAMMPEMADHIFVDPYRRDTAACVGLAAVYLSQIEPDAVMGVFAADHFISSEHEFGRVVRAAEKLADAGRVVTIGIEPTEPETGYGYIEMGDMFDVVDGLRVHRVRRFVEKPNRERARRYLQSKKFLWNSGMFVWSIPTLLGLFERHLPDTHSRLMRIRESLGTSYEDEIADREYEQMQRISVDYGIMEKLDDILVIRGEFDWNDIGSWRTVCDVMPKDGDGNAVKATHIGVDTKNCLILGTGGRVVATIGIEDLVVVDTDDALLICHKDRTQDVKKIVDKLEKSRMEGYL
ncbi:MAG TPA: mannose-1-phosphate guanylyltransferase [Armatimonadota bacterium]|nr:mannose-1-phosphate guanylyltransferase [Armatimonadota bacterium]